MDVDARPGEPAGQPDAAANNDRAQAAQGQQQQTDAQSVGLVQRFRSVFIVGLSFVLTSLVVGNAYYQRQQFYPSVVYITKSNASMAVIYIQSFVFVILFGKLMRKVFFGRLRAAEFEHLMEGSWYAVTETCLAFTVFKDDISPKFVALFTLLLFVKSFHWLAEGRVDFMERSPSISALFHIRVVSLAVLLAAVDVQFIGHAYVSTWTKGPSVQLVFGFEYAVLLTIVANTMVKYILHTIDLYSENPWENKAVFMLYTELAVGLIKVVLYFVFIGIMVRIYTLPLFAVRPMYLTMRAFKKAFNDVILSRRAIHNMNTLYPDATEEELANMDNVCIICREEMQAPSTKKLPCNHIFHKNCLRSWFQRQQTCPTCRLDILRHSVRQGQQQQQQQQPQQQAQAQQQPGAPLRGMPPGGFPFPPFDPNFFAQQLAAAGRQQQQQQQQRRNANTASSSSSTAATSTGATTNQLRGPGAAGSSSMPFVPPPPMFPPFFSPFTIPPPMPPPNFGGLTDSELRAMEGNERDNVEARIRCLRNIQVLLDAAVMEMQQYSSVVSRLNSNTTATTASSSIISTPSATTNSTADDGGAAAATVSAGAAATTPSDSGAAGPIMSSVATTPSDSGAAGPIMSSSIQASGAAPGPTRESTGAKPKIKPTAAAEAPDEGAVEILAKMDDDNNKEAESAKDSATAEQEELRRRRLAKFQSSS